MPSPLRSSTLGRIQSLRLLIFLYSSSSPRLLTSQRSFSGYFFRKPSDAFPPFLRRVFSAPYVITGRCKYVLRYFTSVEIRVKICCFRRTDYFICTNTYIFTTGTALKPFVGSSTRRPTSFGFTLFGQKLIVLQTFKNVSAHFQPIIVFCTRSTSRTVLPFRKQTRRFGPRECGRDERPRITYSLY